MADVSLLFNVLVRDNTAGGLNSASSRFEKFKAATTIAAIGIVGAAATMGKAMVDAAATQSANFAKYEQITKQGMDATAAATARGLNLSQASYADYFAQLSAMYQSNGVDLIRANAMAAESMKTAADAAAFGNTTVAKAVEAQLGLLKGSGELWEAYSVSIKASDISSRMKAEGLNKLKGAELKAAEATVRHNLAQEKAKIFLGQAAKEAGSMESRQQKLAATVEDLKAKYGAGLLVAVEAVLGKLQQMADWVEANETKTKLLAMIVGGLATAIVGVTVAMRVAAAASAIWTGAMWLLNAAFLGNPIGAIVMLIVALGTAFVVAWKKSETFRDIVIGAWNMIVAGVGKGVKALVWFVSGWADNALGAFQRIMEGLGHLPDWLGGGKADRAAAAIQNLRNNITSAVDHMNSEIDRITRVVQIDVNVVTHRYDAEKVGVGQSDLNEVADEKGYRARRAKRLAEEQRVTTSTAPKVDTSSYAHFNPSGSSSGGAGKAAATVEKKLKADPHRLTLRYGKLLASGMADGLADGGKQIGEKVTELLAKIKAKIDAAKDIANGIRDAFKSAANVTSAEPGSFRQLMDQMKRRLDQAKAYTDGVIQLRKAGLNKTSLDQIVAAGPEGGLAAIEQIVNGGRGAVAMLNDVMADINAQGKKLGYSEAKARTGIDLSRPPDRAVIGSGRQRVEVKFDFTGSGDDALIKMIRKAIKVRGGNVQVALGT